MKIDLFCIASGPSLLNDDCELIKLTGIKTMAVNNTWEMVPWCNYIYAGDEKWWDAYGEKIPNNIDKWTSSKRAATKFKINLHSASGPFNSGMRSLIWALQNGFRNIALLGFDCSIKNGVHWHGLHDVNKNLSNPDKVKIDKWEGQFLKVWAMAGRLKANIINCSRYTELKCFKTAKLSEVI